MASLKMGRIFGISIELHITFIAFILLIALALALADPKNFLPTMILLFFLFVSVFLHELTHSIVAISKGVKVKKITLLPIGGIAFTEEMPKNPRDEFLIAIAGPLFNFAVVFLILLLNLFLNASLPSIQSILSGIGMEEALMNYPLFALLYVNLILGAFNLFLPALPLDGGRVLRSLLSMIMNPSKATSIVSKLSMVIAIILFLIGLFSNIMLAVIAAFIYFGASFEGETAKVNEILGETGIKELINKRPVILDGSDSIEEAFEEMEKRKETGFLVELNSRSYGFISIELMKKTGKKKWNKTKIKNIAARAPFVSIEENAAEVMNRFLTKDYSILPVKEGNELVGVIEQEKLMKLFQLKKLEKEA